MTPVVAIAAIPTFGVTVPAGAVGVLVQRDRELCFVRFGGTAASEFEMFLW